MKASITLTGPAVMTLIMGVEEEWVKTEHRSRALKANGCGDTDDEDDAPNNDGVDDDDDDDDAVSA